MSEYLVHVTSAEWHCPLVLLPRVDKGNQIKTLDTDNLEVEQHLILTQIMACSIPVFPALLCPERISLALRSSLSPEQVTVLPLGLN